MKSKLIVGAVVLVLAILVTINLRRPAKTSPETIHENSNVVDTTLRRGKERVSVTEISVLGKTFRIGAKADDVFLTITSKYRIHEPTVVNVGNGMIVTHHFRIENKSVDMTFERPGNWYVLTGIIVSEE